MAKLYNYKFTYDHGQVTELLKCDHPFVLKDTTKWYKMILADKSESITINIEKVTTIEEWITEE